MRVDWALNDEGTWRRASVTISSIFASEIGDSFLSGYMVRRALTASRKAADPDIVDGLVVNGR